MYAGRSRVTENLEHTRMPSGVHPVAAPLQAEWIPPVQHGAARGRAADAEAREMARGRRARMELAIVLVGLLRWGWCLGGR